MAGAVRALILKYSGDATSLKATAKEIEGAHTQMGSNLGQVSTFMQGQLSKLSGAFGVNLGSVKGIVGEGETALKGLAGAGGEAAAGAESAGAGIAGIAGPIGIGIAAAVGLAVGLKGAADVAASMAGEIRKLQAVTGSSAEDASRLRAEFVHFGIDVDTGGASLVRFSKNLEEGGPKFKAWFTEAELADMKGQDLTKDLPLLAEKYQSLGTAVERNTFLLDTFGRGGTALRPILSANADEIVRVGKEADKLGLTFGEKGLAQAKAYTMAQRDMGEAFKGIEVTLGQAAIPAITNFLHWITTGIEDLRAINGWIESVDHGLGGLGTILGGPIAWGMKAWHLVMGDSTKAVAATRTELEAENQALADNAAATQKAAQEVASWTTATMNTFSIVPTVVTNISNLGTQTASTAKSQRQAADDQAHLNELRAAGVINTKALESAEKGIETAAKGAESASVAYGKSVEAVTALQKKEADAAKALADILNGPAPADAAKAVEDLGKAHDDSAEAAIRFRAAQAAADTAQADNTLTADQQAQALIDLNRAKYGVTDATNAEAAAAKALYDLQHEADAGSAPRVAAEQALQKAHEDTTDGLRAEADALRAVTDATNAEADAAKALQVAQAPDEALVKGIAAAQRSLADDLTTVGGVTKAVTTTFAEFKVQMDKQITDMLAWASNMQFLMDHQVSAAILEPLAALGPKAGPELQALRDEVVLHGTGAINDLGSRLTTATGQVTDQLSAWKTYWQQNGIVIPATVKFDDATLQAMATGGAIGGAHPIPHLALGGPVPGPVGVPRWAVVHGGETVFTPGQFSDLLAGMRGMRTAGTADIASSGTVGMVELHTHLYLDGKEIADNVTTHQLNSARRNGNLSGGRF
jgi:hypothetical protein